MKVAAFLICDKVDEFDDGRFTLTGVGANWFSVPSFPANVEFKIFIQIYPDPEDVDTESTIHLDLAGTVRPLTFAFPSEKPYPSLVIDACFQVSTPGPKTLALDLPGSRTEIRILLRVQP